MMDGVILTATDPARPAWVCAGRTLILKDEAGRRIIIRVASIDGDDDGWRIHADDGRILGSDHHRLVSTRDPLAGFLTIDPTPVPTVDAALGRASGLLYDLGLPFVSRDPMPYVIVDHTPVPWPRVKRSIRLLVAAAVTAVNHPHHPLAMPDTPPARLGRLMADPRLADTCWLFDHMLFEPLPDRAFAWSTGHTGGWAMVDESGWRWRYRVMRGRPSTILPFTSMLDRMKGER